MDTKDKSVHQRYYEKHKEKKKAYAKEYRRLNPDKVKEQKRLYKERHPDRVKKRGQSYYRRNKDKARAYKRFRTFGITLEQYQALRIEQQNCCGICKCSVTSLYRDLDVDHCHTTGIIRGLLCSACNTAIGLLKDDTTVVLAAHRYLSKYEKK